MNDQNCWDLKPNCPMKGKQALDTSCPAYLSGRSCWETDWRRVIKQQPSAHHKSWLFFLEKCPGCNVFAAHPQEMTARLDEVDSLRPH